MIRCRKYQGKRRGVMTDNKRYACSASTETVNQERGLAKHMAFFRIWGITTVHENPLTFAPTACK